MAAAQYHSRADDTPADTAPAGTAVRDPLRSGLSAAGAGGSTLSGGEFLPVWSLGERIKPTFEEFWDHSIDFMDKLEDMSVERSESDPSIYDLPDDEDQ